MCEVSKLILSLIVVLVKGVIAFASADSGRSVGLSGESSWSVAGGAGGLAAGWVGYAGGG